MKPIHGTRLWESHPHVRTGSELMFRERAADWLKAKFGSWTFLIILNTIFIGECSIHIATSGKWDPGLLLLNLFLSWLAAQQGGALQIAANRGDRISAEVATGTHQNSEKLLGLQQQLLGLQQQQMQILGELRALKGGEPGGGPERSAP